MDQRLIVRIQLLIPLYATSSWLALHWERANSFIAPLREMYEAFVIYTFFTLLTNLLGGERDIIISCSGRAPKPQLPPFSNYLSKVDISDPRTFLMIKRGILQYVWIKPALSLTNAVAQYFGFYRPNVIAWNSAYFWTGLFYNVSISLSLYFLALFWYCLHDDLEPYRPMPKFLCIKAVIFFSFWQGFAISLLKLFGFFTETGHMIQNTLLCFEMLGFSIGHWFAFSYQDYSSDAMIGFGRLPVSYAVRDAFGITDLVTDFRSTFYGSDYHYRQFDSVEAVLDHPDSKSRQARINAGLRYKNGGKSKYWLPKSTLKKRQQQEAQGDQRANLLRETTQSYGGVESSNSGSNSINTSISEYIDEDGLFGSDYEEIQGDEDLYAAARRLVYGDYNYPVITVQESMPYVPIFDQQKAHGGRAAASKILSQEYQSFETSGEADNDERNFFETSYESNRTRTN